MVGGCVVWVTHMASLDGQTTNSRAASSVLMSMTSSFFFPLFSLIFLSKLANSQSNPSIFFPSNLVHIVLIAICFI
jgi:hypothetical protein